MTCIAAYVKGGKAHMASDSMAHNEGDMATYGVQKMKKGGNGGFIIGCAGLHLAAHHTLHQIELPYMSRYPNDDRWAIALSTTLRSHFTKDHTLWQLAKGEHKEFIDAEWLVATARSLYHIDDSFTVIRLDAGYGSIGSGEQVATGVLWTAHTTEFCTPELAVNLAVQAAVHHLTNVGGEVAALTIPGR